MRLKIAGCALALVAFLGTCAFAQEQGTQANPGQTAGGAQAGAQAPQAGAQAPQTASPAQTQKPTRIRVGGNVAAASLVHPTVFPIYPADAKAAHISGTVVLHAIIAKDGSVLSLDVISGPPELTKAAMDAVKQWRYRPTLLNGEPVEVDTTISVVFTLGGETPPSSPEKKSDPQILGGHIPPGVLDSIKPQSEKPIDPQLKADILHLLDVNHAKDKELAAGREIFRSLRPMLVQSLPPTPSREKIVDSYTEKLLALLQTDVFTERLVATYAKYLSDEDIKEMTRFYETPAGQHFNEVMPELFGDLNKIGQQIAMENMANIFKDLCKEYPELEGVAQFCPKENKENKSLLIEPNITPALNASGATGGK